MDVRPAGSRPVSRRPRPRALSALLTVLAVLLGGPLFTGAASAAGPADRAASAHHAGTDRPALTGVLGQQSRAATLSAGEHLTPHHGPPLLLPPPRPRAGTDPGPGAASAPYGSAATAHRATTRGRAPPDDGALQRSRTAHRQMALR
ncbi:hypothetical protein [Streptomyces sp. Ru87]|uniref:hypothetical protein n=1 Tax=Streptomyces sp. Ru87 TaxID=2044307 RepID=UPI000BF5C60F|nr:hypothetical protein [Streptomyces sp. Ru87]PGH47719.1 hypothetical protein CRI70_27005 [Streptomyces sp. Ru87]